VPNFSRALPAPPEPPFITQRRVPNISRGPQMNSGPPRTPSVLRGGSPTSPIGPQMSTVWMLEILSLIRSDGDPSWCRSVPNWDRGPWFETVLGLRRAQRNPRPRLISSHLPVQLFAKAFFTSKAKVIYTVRNPKDVLVSLYHFARIFRPYKDPGSLEEFMDKFLEGDGA
uniref:Sulfotransferase n=1 Tax=Anas zonorhyncha TaxID=75864 RepID=A0A8B9V2T6_9AVES